MNYQLLLTTSRAENKRRSLLQKVNELALLPAGFSHGEGVPIQDRSIAQAEEFIWLAAQLELDADVFPNLDGGCAVAFYRGEERVEVSISANGDRFELRVERGIGFQYEDVIEPLENASLDVILDQIYRLESINKDTWKLFESSTSDSLTEQLGDFETQSAKTQPSQPAILLTEKVDSRFLWQPALA